MSQQDTSRVPTIGFDEPSALDAARVGGKAASLGRLCHSGFRVPPGFSVTTDVYRDVVARSGTEREISALLAPLDYSKADHVDEVAAKIRSLITAIPVPEDIATEILARYAALGDEVFVAVRSSGTAEDLAKTSFAGLHDTYLDIRGEKDLIDAVRRCWASMWTARALAYRHDNGFDNSTVSIAVIVQQMVTSEVSGVMFTANPVNNRVNEFVVNANWGLGESVVSGITTPDEFILARGSKAVLRSNLGSKERQVVRNPETGVGTVTIDVPLADQQAWTLSPDHLSQLGALGQRAMEAAGGFPQDVEWAWADGAFYLLQSRAVTGADFTWDDDIDDEVQVHPDNPDTIWTHSWADEYWTGAITPLFYSLREIEFGRIHRDWMTLCGFPDVAKMPLHKYRRGTIYYNCDIDERYYQYVLPRALRAGMMANVEPNRQAPAIASPFDFPRYLRAHGRIAGLDPDKRMFRWFKVMDDFMTNRVHEADGPSAEQWNQMSDAEIKKQMATLMDLWVDFVGAEWCGFFLYAPTAFTAMGWMLANWYDGDNAGIYLDLITGSTERTKSVEEGHILWKMADQVKNSEKLKALFHEHEGAEFFAALETEPEATDLLATYRILISEHGHRGHADRDVYFDRRVEQPALDYAALRSLLSAGEAPPPEESERRLNERREAAAADAIANISRKPFGALKAQAFKFALGYAHRFLVLRDNERHWLDRITMSKKNGFLVIGRRLVERGLLQRTDDFYFLSIGELYALLDGHGNVEFSRAKVDARRRAFERVLNQEEAAPTYIQHGAPVALGAAAAAQGDGVIVGLGTSRGRTQGRARVIKDLRDIGVVEHGDILVCNSTDPGWVPVFMVISGLVLETGGMLAHGSCLSREYGLPAVTAANAMRLIPDGATIEVDGDTGVVTILDDMANAEATAVPELSTA